MANANVDELCAHMRGRRSVGMTIIEPCPICTGRVDEYQAAVAARDAERNADVQQVGAFTTTRAFRLKYHGQDARKKLEVPNG